MLKYIMCMVFLLVFGDLGWFFVQGWFGLIAFFFFCGFMGVDYLCNIGYFFGCDLVSFGLVLLTVWISMLMFLASWSEYSSGFCSFFMFLVIVMCIVLMLCFVSVDILFFYIVFESSLIPIFFLVLGFGYQPERLQAGMYLLLYMVFSSFPLMLGIFGLYYSCFSFYGLGVFLEYNDWIGFFWSFSLVFSFLVSSPMYFLHLWLPKAHVEAPISGSMILAGVLLSLGGYGLMRFMFFLSVFVWSSLLVSFGLVGGVVIGLMCLRQGDISSLIAYSSVVHMGVVLGGLFTFSKWGLMGCLVLMIGHGLCSSGLFCLANIVYVRLGSRSMLLSKGMMVFMPGMCFWWFMFSVCNMSAPPSLGLFGEIWLIIGMVSWSWIVLFLVFFVLFFGACYSLYMYSGLQHGVLGGLVLSGGGGYVSEFLLLFLHWYPLNFFFFVIDCILL